MDVMMPGMDGYDVRRAIKENPETADIPMIFITSKTDEQDEARGFRAGAVDYITKPFSPLIVQARVKTHVELKRRGDMLERLAVLDGLTGIPNRRRFDQFVEAEWKSSLRRRLHLAFVLVDIDFFKLYNDCYGHQEGDECLKKIARASETAASRSEDFAARYGGEEFACVLPETTNEGAVTVAERIMQGVRQLNIPHAESKVAQNVTVSVGVAATIPTACNNFEGTAGNRRQGPLPCQAAGARQDGQYRRHCRKNAA